MILYNVSAVKGESPMFARKFFIGGDSQSTILLVDLAKSPVAMEFRGGKKPTYALLKQSTGTSVDLSITDGILKFQFPEPPALGERLEVELEFWYESEQ